MFYLHSYLYRSILCCGPSHDNASVTGGSPDAKVRLLLSGARFSEQTLNIGDLLHNRDQGYVDMIPETCADLNEELRCAVVTSVLQHIGSQSSKTSALGRNMLRGGPNVAQNTWNYQFETCGRAETRALPQSRTRILTVSQATCCP